MLTIQQIDFKIQELLRSVIDETSPEARINRGVIDSLCWLKNNNDLRTEEQVKLKIKRYEEELLGLNAEDVHYREKKARIKELQNAIS